MSKKIIRIYLFILALVFTACSWAGNKGASKNLINEKKALQIAEENFVKTYGKEVLKQKPFQATLKDGFWTVTGTTQCPENEVCKGGLAIIDISVNDGKVIKITHEK